MKSEEGEAEKEEKLGEKLRRGVLVGKSRGPFTPVPSWSWAHNNHSSSVLSLSARKLAAALWEFNHSFPLFQMHHHRSANNASAAAASGAGADPRLRRHHHYILHKDRAPVISNFLADASPSSPDQVLLLWSWRCKIHFMILEGCWGFMFTTTTTTTTRLRNNNSFFLSLFTVSMLTCRL